jgi:acyl transferase domain-containing protein
VAVLASPDETEGPPLAVVAGSAVNQDGRSSSLTAPNGPSQSALVAEVLGAAGVDPQGIGAAAVHGTGSP